jgi:hypothetical protein
MIDLHATYQQLARPWTHEQLADHYREANRRADQVPEVDEERRIRRPVAMLATAVPACATVCVAIHVLHVLPAISDPELAKQLLGNVEEHAAVVLQRCHRALELDGRTHDYTADEWLPAVYDIAGAQLEAARLDREPPSLVEDAQDAVGWLARAIADVDRDGPDAAAALVDGLGRMLALYVFADVARHATAATDE